jgi:hypothetical protein
MTRQEMKDYITKAGVEFRSGLTKAELQVIIDRIHVHRNPIPIKPVPQPRPVPRSVPVPATEGEPEPEVFPEEAPEEQPEELEPSPLEIGSPEDEPQPVEEPGAEPDPKAGDEFTKLLGQIGSAKAPEPPLVDDSFFGDDGKPLFKKAGKKKKGQSSPDSFRIEGYILLLVVDVVFPFVFAFANNALDKKIKVDATDLKLSDMDFKKLEPLADQAADYIAVEINPIAGFFLVSTFMYGSNLMYVRLQKSKE